MCAQLTAVHLATLRIVQTTLCEFQCFSCHSTTGAAMMGRCAGCLHPEHDGFFETPGQYLAWYRKHGPLRGNPDAPVVTVLLYRCVLSWRRGWGQLIYVLQHKLIC